MEALYELISLLSPLMILLGAFRVCMELSDIKREITKLGKSKHDK